MKTSNLLRAAGFAAVAVVAAVVFVVVVIVVVVIVVVVAVSEEEEEVEMRQCLTKRRNDCHARDLDAKMMKKREMQSEEAMKTLSLTYLSQLC